MSKASEVYLNHYKNGNYHLGKLMMDCFLLQRDKDAICQIDAWTNKLETYGSQQLRSVKLARCLRKLGLQPGDVLAIGGRNHIDVYIPFYAALFNGLPVVGVDPYYKYDEIKKLCQTVQPKIAFCEQYMVDTYRKVDQELGLDLKIYTFDGGNSLTSLIETCDDGIEGFQCAEFDQDSVYAWLVTTSGTTGGFKVAAFKHDHVVSEFLAYIQVMPPDERTGIHLNISPVQWISSFISAISMPISNNTKLMTSGPDTVEHTIDIINKYRPEKMAASPSLMSLILNNEKHCDMSCFTLIFMTGSKIYKDLILDLKKRINPKGVVLEMYGLTETIGMVLLPVPMGKVGNCGIPWPRRPVKLVDPNTGEDVTEPNVPGEIYVKGPGFTEYYNDPIATAEAFTEDGWFKTGDLLYRDEDNFYFYVDRIKMLIKYQGNTIMPPELEEVISTIEGVQEVAVTSIPDPLDCERAVACVVCKPGCHVTAEQVKQHVATKLSTKKQLHGGVVFMDELPKTSSGKIQRYKLKQMVLTAQRL